MSFLPIEDVIKLINQPMVECFCLNFLIFRNNLADCQTIANVSIKGWNANKVRFRILFRICLNQYVRLAFTVAVTVNTKSYGQCINIA